MNLLTREVSYFRFKFKIPGAFRNRVGYAAMAKRYRSLASNESESNKKNEYIKKAEEMENKAREQAEKNKERDANNKINAATYAREGSSLDWRGRRRNR
tara:strand:- start:175 stop:471 length:297 start_codon:yes stop_codon:yes gene_type:complete